MDHLENTTDLYRLEDGSFRLTRGLDEIFKNPGKRVDGPTEADSYDLNKIEPPPLNLKPPMTALKGKIDFQNKKKFIADMTTMFDKAEDEAAEKRGNTDTDVEDTGDDTKGD